MIMIKLSNIEIALNQLELIAAWICKNGTEIFIRNYTRVFAV